MMHGKKGNQSVFDHVLRFLHVQLQLLGLTAQVTGIKRIM